MNKIGSMYRNCEILNYFSEKYKRFVTLKCYCGNFIRRRVDTVFDKSKIHNITCGCTRVITKKGTTKYDYGSFIGKTYREVKVVSMFEKIHNKKLVKFYNLLCKCGTEYSHQCTDLLRRKNEYVPVSCGCLTDNRDCSRTYGEATYRSVYTKYKEKVIKRDSTWDTLDYDVWKNIVSQKCNYCERFQYKNIYYTKNNIFKSKKDRISKVRKLKISDEVLEKYTVPCCGIDRVDSNKQYTVDNCVPCCITCNVMKNALTLEQFNEHILHLAEIIKRKQKESE